MEPLNSFLKINQSRLKRIFQKHLNTKDPKISVSELQILCKNLHLLPVKFPQELISLSSLRSFISRVLNQQIISKAKINFQEFIQILQLMVQNSFPSASETEKAHLFFQYISIHSKQIYQINLIAIQQFFSIPKTDEPNSNQKTRPTSIRTRKQYPFIKQKSIDPKIQIKEIKKKLKKGNNSHRTTSNSPPLRTSVKLSNLLGLQQGYSRNKREVHSHRLSDYVRKDTIESTGQRTVQSSDSRDLPLDQQSEVMKVTVKLGKPVKEEEKKSDQSSLASQDLEEVQIPRKIVRSTTMTSKFSLNFQRFGLQSQNSIRKKIQNLKRNKEVGGYQLMKEKLENFKMNHLRLRLNQTSKKKSEIVSDYRRFIEKQRLRSFEADMVMGLVFYAWKMQWKCKVVKKFIGVQHVQIG